MAQTEKNPRLQQLRERAMRLPLQPGVYIMHDAADTIIYIGKAKALKNRVSQYFGSDKNHLEKVRRMVSQVAYFEYILTDSEYEALVLESSLIKQHKPKYNILLKDDKGYFYIKVTKGPWRRISQTYQPENDGSTYIGPFLGSWSIRQSLEQAQRIFGLPTCSKVFPRDFGKTRPCLNYYIKQCSGICLGKTPLAQYEEAVDEALDYIKSGSTKSEKELTVLMEQAAENLDFELAARLRDRISTMKKSREKQKVISEDYPEQDVFALVRGEKSACLEVFRFSDGRLCDRDTFMLPEFEEESAARAQLIGQYYELNSRIPPVIAVDGAVEDEELLCRMLREKRGGALRLYVPQKGTQARLVEMCRSNAAEQLAQSVGLTLRETGALDELARLLGLSAAPAYIEAYDISNLAGGENVAGMIVYENGRPCKSAYRKFKIQTVVGQDDYGSMREVITRRFAEYEAHKQENTGFGRMPDLILLDGGRGHVAAVEPLLRQLGYTVPVFGMVKDDKHRTRAIALDGGEISIQSTRRAFTLISDMQEEVHRFAIGFHRQQRKKTVLGSSLTAVPGVGEARARLLMKSFGTVTAIKEASVEELAAVKGVSRPAAQAIFQYFHPAAEE